MSFLMEEVLSTKDRNKLKKATFGLPEERKYPLNDAKHVRSALAYFRFCSPDKKKQLASRILAAAKKFNVEISPESEVYKLVHESIEPENYNINNDRVVLEADDDDDEEDYTEELDNPTDEPEDYTKMLDDDTDDNNNVDLANDDGPEDYTQELDTGNDPGGEGEPAPDPDDYTQDLDDTGTTDDGPEDYTNMVDDENPIDDNTNNDEPEDYTQDMDNDNPPTDDTNDGPEDYTQELDDSNPEDTNNNVNQNNPGDMPQGDTGTDNANGGDEPEDYTQDLDDGGDASADDGGNPEGEDPAGADVGAGATGGGVNPDIQDLQNTTFSNLTPQQLQLRVASVKQSFIDLHNEIVDTIERLNVVNKSSDNIESINFVNNTLSDLKKMLLDSVGESFDTRSLIENQIVLQRFIATYGMCIKILDKITKKNEMRQSEK